MKQIESSARFPCIFVLLDVRLLGDSDWEPRKSKDHAILYVSEGAGTLELGPEGEEAASYTLRAESCFVLAPATSYRVVSDCEKPLQCFKLTFDGIRLNSLADAGGMSRREPARFPFAGVVHWYERPEIEGIVRSLYDSRAETEALSQFRRQRQFLELLDQLWQQVRTKESGQRDAASAVQRAIAYMEEAYDQELTRDLLAEVAGVSPGHFSFVFRKETGKSPMDMLAEIRIDRAKQWLLTSDRSLRTIAQSVGYSNEFYFSSRFKQVVGLSPSDYVRRSRSSKVASSQAYTTYLRSSAASAPDGGRPERIVGLFLEDDLLALGVKPMLQYARSGYYQKYLAPYLHGVDKLDMARIDFERLRRARPDMILLGFADFAAQGRYDLFAGIAPTFVFQRAGEDWRSTLRSLGQLIGREREAVQAIERYEDKARKARHALAQTVGKETVALLRLHFKDGLCLYSGPGGYTAPVLYDDLGLRMPPLLQEWYRRGRHPVNPITIETLQSLDADHLLLVVDEGQDKLLRELQQSPLWQDLPVVRKHRVFEGSTDVWMTFGIIAHEQKIDHVLHALT